MSELLGDSSSAADSDGEARKALWQAICSAAAEVRRNFHINSIIGTNGELKPADTAPTVPTWQFVEALSLLAIILRSDAASAEAINLFGKTGPIEIIEDGVTRYLWAQPLMRGDSSLGGRPDLVVTISPRIPSPDTIVRVVEAKCVRGLDAQTIRAEFGKGHDLRVGSYFIWTYYTPSSRIIDGARGLGIDLVTLGFDTDWRRDLIASADALIAHVSNSLLESRRAGRFAQALLDGGREAHLKLSGS